MSKKKKELKTTDNPTVYNRLMRYKLRCPMCPPNRGENCKRRGKHGKTKPRYKNKRQ